jgi:hypothetical protein
MGVIPDGGPADAVGGLEDGCETHFARPLEFSDESVSGTKRNRAGLNAMLAAAERGEFHVLYIFSLSRLARESIITMPLLKKLVHIHRVPKCGSRKSLPRSIGGGRNTVRPFPPLMLS